MLLQQKFFLAKTAKKAENFWPVISSITNEPLELTFSLSLDEI